MIITGTKATTNRIFQNSPNFFVFWKIRYYKNFPVQWYDCHKKQTLGTQSKDFSKIKLNDFQLNIISYE